jgi:hypothetical protein
MMRLFPERSGLLLLVIVAGLLVTGGLIVFPDTALRLRTQVLQSEEIASVTKTLTWKVPDDIPLGERTVTFKADDGEGGVIEKAIKVVVEASEVKIQDFAIEPRETSANLTFKTDRSIKDRKIRYDVRGDVLRVDKDNPTVQSTKDHTLLLDELKPCTTYTLELEAKNLVATGQSAVTGAQIFTTKGCPGGAAVQGVARGDFSKSTGGNVGLEGKIQVAVPGEFAGLRSKFISLIGQLL